MHCEDIRNLKGYELLILENQIYCGNFRTSVRFACFVLINNRSSQDTV